MMTDKEQIMINDVDVSECVHYEDLSCTAFRDCCGYPLDCKDFFSCNYKQLTRKTQECEQKDKELLSNEKIINKLMKEVDELRQECEELKKQLIQKDEVNTFFNTPVEGWSSDPCNICECKNNYDRYRKALEEIEAVCLEDTRTFADGTQVRYDSLDEILDIISKAKGEELCQK